MIGMILSFFTSTLFKKVSTSLMNAYELKIRADTDEKKLEADTKIAFLQAQRDVLLAEQQRLATAWVRPAFALLVWLFWAKLIVWDTLLKLGVTPYPGEHVMWFVTLIPTAYFLVRPFERK